MIVGVLQKQRGDNFRQTVYGQSVCPLWAEGEIHSIRGEFTSNTGIKVSDWNETGVIMSVNEKVQYTMLLFSPCSVNVLRMLCNRGLVLRVIYLFQCFWTSK